MLFTHATTLPSAATPTMVARYGEEAPLPPPLRAHAATDTPLEKQVRAVALAVPTGQKYPPVHRTMVPLVDPGGQAKPAAQRYSAGAEVSEPDRGQ